MTKLERSSLTLRLPAPIKEWVAIRARGNFTSQNDEIVRILREQMSLANKKSGTTAS